MTEPQIPSLYVRILECGRRDGVNEVVFDMTRGQLLKVSGFSDEMTKRFASVLYKPVRIDWQVQDE